MKCPKCGGVMQSVTVDTFVVERCGDCRGMWFNLREYEHVLEIKGRAAWLDSGDAARGHEQDAKRDIECPECHVKMLKMTVPSQPHIKYESCPVCYGAYFDAGEVKDLADESVMERVKVFFGLVKK